jgi:peptidoglycan hydrolase-like protein with peptidoglycan-binding domain
MMIWKASHIHMISGAILCFGSLTCLTSGDAVAAGASPQLAVSEPALIGAPRILGPRAGNPSAALRQALTATDLEPGAARPAIHRHAAGQSDAAREMPSTKSIQRALSSLGYDPGPIDGLMGPKTQGAIAAYEEARGWNSSGTGRPRLQADLIAALTPQSPASPVSGRDADPGALLSVITPPATATNPADTEAATNRPVRVLVQSAAASAARCQVAEPENDIELAIADFFHVLREMVQYSVRIFTGPGSRDLTTTKADSGTPGSDHRLTAIRNETASNSFPTSGGIARAAARTEAGGPLSGRVHLGNSP